ncbi:hypothetical protein ABZX90_11085 [Streptomyces sp. NPDC002935]|uniref:hypothetical protein n=1 Tax=unclassified Streptomyces TaxID=2593676 RepID=UPI003332ED5E
MARFEDHQSRFWDTSSDYGVQPTLTDRAIGEAERLLNVRLPDALLDLLGNRSFIKGLTSAEEFESERSEGSTD